jgi:hypothetical protein
MWQIRAPYSQITSYIAITNVNYLKLLIKLSQSVLWSPLWLSLGLPSKKRGPDKKVLWIWKFRTQDSFWRLKYQLKFFGSDHLVALFKVVENNFFFFNKKQNVQFISQCLLTFSGRAWNFALDWQLKFYKHPRSRDVAPEMEVPENLKDTTNKTEKN